MWTGERDSPQVEHFQAATESVEKKHRKEERAISSQRWDGSESLQPCKHAVQSGRHTPGPPQHSHHSALTSPSTGMGPLTNTHPPRGHQPQPRVLLWGCRQKGTPGHHLLLSPAAPAAEGPDDGSTPGTCPPAKPTAGNWSFPPARSQQKHWHGSASGVPGKSPSHY